jgi:hypothetical protein
MKEMDETLNSRGLRGFNEIETGNYNALPEKIFTQYKGPFGYTLCSFFKIIFLEHL